jgi:polar amino acid transport system ATP-binding protein
MNIDIRGLNKKYDNEIVLKDFNLVLENVEAVAVLGKSGSGKSTLLRLISGIEGYDEGLIRIDKQEVSQREFKDRVGFVFQSSSLFPHLTVFNNIVLILNKIKGVPKERAEKKVIDLLARFGLIEHKDKYPYMLSGGQQQRVSIVRALALDVDIFFFDEPTSALDPILTKEVLDMVKELRLLGKKFFIVTHEVGFARKVADYVIFLNEGRIIEQGSIEIIDDPKTDAFKEFLSIVL